MPDPSAWETLGGLGAVIIFLGAVVFGLQRLGILSRRPPAPAPAPAATWSAGPEPADGLADQVAALDRRLAVVEERTRTQADSIERLGRVHSRIDEIARTTAHTDGQIAEMGRSMRLVMRRASTPTSRRAPRPSTSSPWPSSAWSGPTS